jgi:hypothetical protein
MRWRLTAGKAAGDIPSSRYVHFEASTILLKGTEDTERKDFVMEGWMSNVMQV